MDHGRRVERPDAAEQPVGIGAGTVAVQIPLDTNPVVLPLVSTADK